MHKTHRIKAFTQGSWLGMRTSAGRTTLPSWLLESRWSSPVPAQDVTENFQQKTNAPLMKETRIDSRPWHAPRVMIQRNCIYARGALHRTSALSMVVDVWQCANILIAKRNHCSLVQKHTPNTFVWPTERPLQRSLSCIFPSRTRHCCTKSLSRRSSTIPLNLAPKHLFSG